jgi:hypothetical protein
MKQPISLVEFTAPKAVDSIVEMLELLLVQARVGDVQGVSCVVCHRDGGVSAVRAVGDGCNPMSMLGAMRIAEADFVDFYIELTHED